MIFRDFSVTPKSFDKAERSAEFVCSSEAPDRHGSIVKQSWRLDWFQKNPVALFGHDSKSPIGRWENVRVENGVLTGRLRFAEGDPLAEKCLNLVGQGVLKAVSVGFIPHSRSLQKREGTGDDVVVFDDNELLEVSLVSIPANPEALARELPLPTPAAEPTAAGKPDSASAQPGSITLTKGDGSLTIVGQAADVAALERRAADAEARARTLEADLAEARTKLVAAETAAAAAKAAEAVEKGRADKLDAARKAAKVDALVGKKIDPADRAFWLEKAVKDEADFDATMARTRDLPTAVDVQVVKAKDPSPPAGSLEPDQAAAKLDELARKRAAETRQPFHLAYGDVQREHPELCS